ncbi:MAG: methylthioribulose 1-phosphate dehydratase [Methylotetracoccus sp.]|nr:methylthioribulose 1-phosphate dehydratase [Methylotetracoccus sp.]
MNEQHLARAARQLIEAGRYISAHGWVPATSGNFSVKLPDGRIAITVSGTHKGQLTERDIMLIDAEGRALDERKPSAESLLHTSIYRRYPEVGAVLHPHSPNSTLASRLFPDRIVLENYELLKALDSVTTHEARVVIPIFPNDQNIPHLALCVEEYMEMHRDVRGYIIAGHGFYTWGATLSDALRHVEALEFLFDLEIRLHGVRKP